MENARGRYLRWIYLVDPSGEKFAGDDSCSRQHQGQVIRARGLTLK